MPSTFIYSWIGADGATRRASITIGDDYGATVSPLGVASPTITASSPTPDAPRRSVTFRETATKASEYAKAEASLWSDGPVSDEVFFARTGPDGCGTCEYRKATPKDPLGFCGQCGCGAALRALLTVKGRMPAAACPLTPPRWGPAPGQGSTALDRLRQVSAVAAGLLDMLAGGKRRREAKGTHTE